MSTASPMPVRGTEILVAYDGSTGADAALLWAGGLAEAQRRDLRVCVARGDLYRVSSWADRWSRSLAEEWVQHARDELAGHELPDAAYEIADGNAVPVILERSAGVATVVLGSRGRTRLGGALLGSVGQQVVRHAHSPVVVVRRRPHVASTAVFVGVDGSEDSMRAMDFALEVARARHAVLVVVECRALAEPGPGDRPGELTTILRERRHQRARVVDDALLAARAAHPEMTIDHELTNTAPAETLARASDRAALLVVGSRGFDAYTGMLLGSVSAEVLAHAHCPVAVVR